MASKVLAGRYELFEKIGLVDGSGALGIMTITPSEGAIIASDVASKASGIRLGFVDRFSGTLIVTGTVSQVEEALESVCNYCKNKLQFTVCEITKT